MKTSKIRRIGAKGFAYGTAAIYAATPNFWTCCAGDYEVELGKKSYPKEMRSHRKRSKRQKCVSRADALKDEAVVIFGPNISGEQAVYLLRQLANQIGKRGLYTGEDDMRTPKFERKVVQI